MCWSGVATRCGTLHTLETMLKINQPLGHRQTQILRHLVELDSSGLAPTTGYLARRFSLSDTRIREVVRSFKRRGYLVKKNPGGLLKLSRKAREIFTGGDNE